jgi:hypothetical protein
MTPAEARLPKRVRNADLLKLSCRFEAPVRLPIRRRQQSSDDRNRVGEIGRQRDNEPNLSDASQRAAGRALARK